MRVYEKTTCVYKAEKFYKIKFIFCTVYSDNFSFISVFLAMLDLGCVRASSSCGRGSSLAVVRWLLLWRAGSRGRWASVAVAHGISCSLACGIFLD